MLTGTGTSKKKAKEQAAYKMCEKVKESPPSSISPITEAGDNDEVCAGSRTEFSLSVVLVTAVVFGRCCMPRMHMTFTVSVAYGSCSAL
jgi:hypothetical protein